VIAFTITGGNELRAWLARDIDAFVTTRK